MSVHVIGAGSLGLLLAARLTAKTGQVVTLVTRTRAQALHLRTSGVELYHAIERPLSEAQREIVSMDAQAWDDPMLVENEVDCVVLTVKQHHLDTQFCERLFHRYGSSRTSIICMQNGMGHLEKLGRFFAPEQLFIAVTTEGARALSNHSVMHTGHGSTQIGPAVLVERQPPLAALLRFLQALHMAGFEAHWESAIEWHVWRKLLINAAINPLTALLQLRNGELLNSQHAQRLLHTLCHESLLLMNGLNRTDFQPLLSWVEDVCRATAQNESSMLQDMRRQRTTEIDAITGSLLRYADQHGIELPTHRRIYQLIKQWERQYSSAN